MQPLPRLKGPGGGNHGVRALDDGGAGPEKLDRLDGLHRDLERADAARRPGLMEEHNHRFHREINLAADSAKLAWSLGTAARYVARGLYGRLPDWPGLAMRDHGRILAALRDGDASTVAERMRDHVVRVGGLLAAHLERRGMRRPAE
ncbi:MAG: FCD domain-containing protein [Actinomadura sp.]